MKRMIVGLLLIVAALGGCTLPDYRVHPNARDSRFAPGYRSCGPCVRR